MEETWRVVREIGKQIGGLGNKIGSFTEGMAFPSMTKLLEERFHMDFIAPRVILRKNGRHLELDVLAYSNSPEIEEVYIVEVKGHLREDGLKQLQKGSSRIPGLLPDAP